MAEEGEGAVVAEVKAADSSAASRAAAEGESSGICSAGTREAAAAEETGVAAGTVPHPQERAMERRKLRL